MWICIVTRDENSSPFGEDRKHYCAEAVTGGIGAHRKYLEAV